jgi:hypothetical protein
MMTLAFTLLLSSCLQEPEPAAAPKLSPELTAIRTAAAKLTEVPNYTFHHLLREEGAPTGAAAADRPVAGPIEFTAHVLKGLPMHFQQGELEAWRQDNVLVWRSGKGEWQRMDGQSMRGRDGAVGGAPASEEELRAMRTRMSLFTAPAAHELVVGFESKIAMVTSSTEGGKTIYVGSLTPEGAAMLSGAARLARGGRSGDAKTDAPSEGTGTGTSKGKGTGTGATGTTGAADATTFQSSGNFRIVVDAKGRVESCTIDTVTSGAAQDRALERKRHAEYRFSAIGETKLEVPAEVTAKFAEKNAEKPVEGNK